MKSVPCEDGRTCPNFPLGPHGKCTGCFPVFSMATGRIEYQGRGDTALWPDCYVPRRKLLARKAAR